MADRGRDATERPGSEAARAKSISLDQLVEANAKLRQELASLRERIERLESLATRGQADPGSAAASPGTKTAGAEETATDDGSSLPPPLNRALLDELRQLQREGAPDMVTRMIDAYMGSAPATRESLHEAIGVEDPEALRRSAHSLKSSSANLGATRLAEMCFKLERIGRGGSTKEAPPLMEAFETEYERVRLALLAERTQGAA